MVTVMIRILSGIELIYYYTKILFTQRVGIRKSPLYKSITTE